jgi:ribosomal protein S18 acetylase RimI-like enzyme
MNWSSVTVNKSSSFLVRIFLLLHFTHAFNFLRPISPALLPKSSSLQFITLEDIPVLEVQQHPSSSLDDDINSKTHTSQYFTSEASYSDLNAVVDLRVDVFFPELVDVNTFHARVLEKLRHRRHEGSICLIVYKDSQDEPRCHYDTSDNIVGTVEFSSLDFKYTALEAKGSENKLYLMDLAVRKDSRKQGIASSLLKSAEKYAISNGYESILLHVDVGNHSALKLYEKHGYTLFPSSPASIQFTEARLHKPPMCYIFLWKQIKRQDIV